MYSRNRNNDVTMLSDTTAVTRVPQYPYLKARPSPALLKSLEVRPGPTDGAWSPTVSATTLLRLPCWSRLVGVPRPRRALTYSHQNDDGLEDLVRTFPLLEERGVMDGQETTEDTSSAAASRRTRGGLEDGGVRSIDEDLSFARRLKMRRTEFDPSSPRSVEQVFDF